MDLFDVLESPDYALLSKQKAKLKLKQDRHKFKAKDIDEHYANRELSQITKPPVKPKQSYKIVGPPLSFQIDIIFLPAYATKNKGHTCFLLLVEVPSRKAHAYVLKSTKMSDILDGYEKFIMDVGPDVVSVTGDDQFNNAEFKEFNHQLGIMVFTGVAKDDHVSKWGDRLGILDSCTRTIKRLITKYMLKHDNVKWTTWLSSIISTYNKAPDSGIQNKTPEAAYDEEDFKQAEFEKGLAHNKEVSAATKLKPGDHVRILVAKHVFEKEKPMFSRELYVVLGQDGYRYKVESEEGHVMRRRFREHELQKVNKATLQKLPEPEKQKAAKKVAKHTQKLTKEAFHRKPAQVVEAVTQPARPKTTRIRQKPVEYYKGELPIRSNTSYLG